MNINYYYTAIQHKFYLFYFANFPKFSLNSTPTFIRLAQMALNVEIVEPNLTWKKSKEEEEENSAAPQPQKECCTRVSPGAAVPAGTQHTQDRSKWCRSSMEWADKGFFKLFLYYINAYH